MKVNSLSPDSASCRMTIPESASDFNQWLQSMLEVARLPGGLPVEFRRKVCNYAALKSTIILLFYICIKAMAGVGGKIPQKTQGELGD